MYKTHTMLDLIPMLETKDIAATAEFYSTKLGFQIKSYFPDDQKPSWVMLEFGKAGIMFSKRFESTKESDITMSGSLYMYPSQVVDYWHRLRAQDIHIEWELQDFHYGMTEFAIRDNNNYLLIFGQSTDEL